MCKQGIRLQNEFYELLPDGIGLQDFCSITGRRDWCGPTQGFERGTFPTMIDLTPANQLLRVYFTDPRDVGKRVLIGPALDQNGNGIYSQDGNPSVNGFYLVLGAPFTTSQMIVTAFTGVQKDATFGDVLLYQVDATTGAQVLLSRYAPDEINPSYRRYFFAHLPCSCGHAQVPHSPCNAPATVDPGIIQLTALAKYEFIPIYRDTDFNIIGNIPALIEECKALRYSDMDTVKGAELEAKSHNRAIKFLNQELTHQLGTYQPAINVPIFGDARLHRRKIGQLI